jgi:hypothetical protein
MREKEVSHTGAPTKFTPAFPHVSQADKKLYRKKRFLVAILIRPSPIHYYILNKEEMCNGTPRVSSTSSSLREKGSSERQRLFTTIRIFHDLTRRVDDLPCDLP